MFFTRCLTVSFISVALRQNELKDTSDFTPPVSHRHLVISKTFYFFTRQRGDYDESVILMMSSTLNSNFHFSFLVFRFRDASHSEKIDFPTKFEVLDNGNFFTQFPTIFDLCANFSSNF